VLRLVRRRFEGWRGRCGAALAGGVVAAVALVDTFFAWTVIQFGNPFRTMPVPFGERVGLVATALCSAPLVAALSAAAPAPWLAAVGMAAARVTVDTAVAALCWRPVGLGLALFEPAYAAGRGPLVGSLLFGLLWAGMLLPVTVLAGRFAPDGARRAAVVSGFVLSYCAVPLATLVRYHGPYDWPMAAIGGGLALMPALWLHWRLAGGSEVRHG